MKGSLKKGLCIMIVMCIILALNACNPIFC